MIRKIQDVLVQKASEHFTGRQKELEILHQSLDRNGPLVSFVHGIGGIGKTSLLESFAQAVRRQNIPVINLDCREIEPSAKGFLTALAQAIGHPQESPTEAGEALSKLGSRVLLLLDGYEVFRLMDTWMRQAFVPRLVDNVRLVLAGREAPVAAWQTGPGWEDLFAQIELGPLDRHEARDMLMSFGFEDQTIERVDHLARGNPLALKLAAAALVEHPDFRLDEINSQTVIPNLVQLYLEDVPDTMTREAIEAGSVVRRVNQSLLNALLPESAPQDIFERLDKLPFVTHARGGLVIHETVRHAIAENLRSSDPSRYRMYRYRAYRHYCKAMKTLADEDLWRYTADILYLIEEPVLREAFFPTDNQLFAVESTRAEDFEDISRIARKHEPADAAVLAEKLYQRMPDAFRVARNNAGRVEGYYVVFDPANHNRQDFEFDPILRNWSGHLEENPLPNGQCALFLRRWLADEAGELPSPVQATFWIDVKGDYVRLRSSLRRVYCCAVAAEVYAPVLQRLGFAPLPRAATVVGDSCYQSVVLDFGAKLFLGWLERHVRASLDLSSELLDAESRELVFEEKRVGLTPLEFGVMSYLYDHEGAAVSRSVLLDKVWGHGYEGGSNVVDARVRDLRKKLGPLGTAIETVTGVGYRFRSPDI